MAGIGLLNNWSSSVFILVVELVTVNIVSKHEVVSLGNNASGEMSNHFVGAAFQLDLIGGDQTALTVTSKLPAVIGA